MRILKLRNIVAVALFSVGAILYAVSPELPRAFVNGKEYYYYDVKKGESIYKVAKQMGVTTSDITSANPQALDGLRAGMRLYIPVTSEARTFAERPAQKPEPKVEPKTEPKADQKAEPMATPAPELVVATESADDVAESAPATAPASGRQTVDHKVRRGESLYGIAQSAGMSLADIIRLNPQAANGVAPGDILKVYTDEPAAPQSAAVAAIEPEEPTDYSLIPSERRIAEKYVVYVDTPDADDPTAEVANADTVSVALVLPFMLSQEEPTKATQLFTEFYEGFLLAARRVAENSPSTHIIVRAYDSAMSTDTVAELMRQPELARANIIVGPDNEAQLTAIAQGMSADTYLFNVFNVKSQLYKTYPHVIQVNIPHGDLYAEAVDEFVSLYPESLPVILSRYDGQADKDAFVSLLKERMDSLGREYRDVTFRNILQVKDLAEIPDSVDCVFVPMSGQRAEFAKITEGIRRFAAERTGSRTALFGYPEWITFRGEYFNRLGENNATIYTRFYAAPNEPARVELEKEFRAEYGVAMLDAAPVQGILGYDSAMYLLQTAISNGGDFIGDPGSYVGIQSAFHYSLPDSADDAYKLVNRAIFIVTFGPNGYIDKKPIL
ncbi:MAG: LysM peptidoglycan-binding domain-containing protein [Bacteroidales bacterium]|nr:LysM peptidoglycan-binding domain-containing protein [Bacteroidales bacterium]